MPHKAIDGFEGGAQDPSSVDMLVGAREHDIRRSQEAPIVTNEKETHVVEFAPTCIGCRLEMASGCWVKKFQCEGWRNRSVGIYRPEPQIGIHLDTEGLCGWWYAGSSSIRPQPSGRAIYVAGRNSEPFHHVHSVPEAVHGRRRVTDDLAGTCFAYIGRAGLWATNGKGPGSPDLPSVTVLPFEGRSPRAIRQALARMGSKSSSVRPKQDAEDCGLRP